MNTKFGILCDKFIEACWLAALVLAPLYMNIYTHRMFEPDKACIIRSLALLMIVCYIIKIFESKTSNNLVIETRTKSSLVKDVSLLEETSSSKFTHFFKDSIFFPFSLFVIAYIVSVIFSAVPYNSLWGGFDRLQGLYTNASFWVIFILAVINIKSKAQIERIISAIIFTSVPIVAYCFIQRFRLDPVPWQQMDPSIRVSATMGNPIFLSAYLIMTIPLTLVRAVSFFNFIFNFIYNLIIKWSFSLDEMPSLSSILYILLALLQITTVFLSQSRGPMIGMGVSIVFFGLMYAWTYRRWILFIVIIILVITGLIFLALFNLPHFYPDKKLPSGVDLIWQGTFGKLMKVPYLCQLGRLLETEPGSSGRTRIILWNGVWKLIKDKDDPYRYRLFIGYGPESLSTVYYKNYTMELAKLEGINVHADRSHNGYLDVWVMHGIFGLVAYLFFLGSITYIALKTIFKKPKKQKLNVEEEFDVVYPTAGPLTLIMIGLITAIIAHLVEIFVGIAIVSTFTHFWLLTAAVYATHKIKLFEMNKQLSKEEPEQRLNKDILPQESFQPNASKTAQIDHWRFYLFAAYIIFTLVIVFILFIYSWPEGKIVTPDIKDTRNTLLMTFCGWLLCGFIVGIVAWPSYLFWTYAGQTLIMAVIMVKKYWPDDTTNTDMLIIYSWWWILAGIIIGAISLKREEKPTKLWHFSNVLLGSVMLIGVFFIIIRSNLSMLRADGFYKFCFSYDVSAEDFLRNGKIEASYRTRLACIRYFQNALKYAPDERAYLNGSGRNFLELSKLVLQRNQKDTTNEILTPPSIKEIIEMDWERFKNFGQRDFFLCSASCIQRAYELDVNNFERIIAMIRIYRYWGDLDKDITKFKKGLELCSEAKKASPLNTKVDDEINGLQRLIAMHSPK